MTDQKPTLSDRISELEKQLRYAQIEIAYLKGLRRSESSQDKKSPSHS